MSLLKYDARNVLEDGYKVPKGTKVYRCVHDLMKKGRSKVSAIKICQESTGQSYKTGEKSKALHRAVTSKKPR